MRIKWNIAVLICLMLSTVCTIEKQALGQNLTAMESKCLDVLSHLEDVILFSDYFSGINESQELARFLYQRSSTFKVMADKLNKNFGELTSEQKQLLLVQYHKEFFSRFEAENLKALQNEALLQGLQSHGYEPTSRDGRRELEVLSQQNLDRIANKLGLLHIENLDTNIREALDQLEFAFYRDANGVSVLEGSVISSRQIKEYGFSGGINSTNGFNSQFLKSDDNVFFFLDARIKSESYSQDSSEYGNYRYWLSPQFPKDKIWVSLFMMHPLHLRKFGELALRDQYSGRNLQQEITGNGFGRGQNIRVYKPSPLAMELKNQLYLYDFTVTDYQQLILRQLGTFMQSLKSGKSSSQSKYTIEDVFSILQGKQSLEIEKEFLKTVVYNPLGIHSMEAKVPVAIAKEYLR